MIVKLNDYKKRMEYIAMLHPYTLIDVFERPDDDEVKHTYVATGDYKASMADGRLFSGTSCEALATFQSSLDENKSTSF
jgi:hypothetical protein